MKKIFVIMLLLLAAETYSQYSLTVYLQSSGVPVTGKAGVMVFTRYPHSYGTDNVSGLTISEIGSTGSYVAKGFTTYEYVKLWVDGVAQAWFDSVQVGDITAYITTRLSSYVTLATGQTITGAKLFDNITYFDGTVQQTTNANFEMYKPQLHASSPWISWIDLPTNALLSRTWGDSSYVPKSWMFLNSSKITLQGSYKLWGLGNTSPFTYNTSHFGWNTSTGLYLVSPPDINYDSLTLRVDTTISENPYFKYWSMRRGFWSQIDSNDIRVYYTNTYPGTKDSMNLLNVTYQSSNNTSTGLSGSTWVFADTITVPTFGTWQITYSAVCVFPAATGSDAYDSIFVDMGSGTGADKQLAGSETYITHWYDNTAQTGGSQTVTWSFVYHTSSDNRTLFLRGKNSTAAVGTMYINRSNVTYTRIK